MAYFSAGPQGGQSILAPSYNKYTYKTTVTTAQLNTNSTNFIRRVTGPQRITFKYKTGMAVEPTWSFSVKGGTNTGGIDVEPMFPNTLGPYNQGVQFVIDDDPPRGCTAKTQPKPTGTTRTNVFRITESVTGNNFIIDVAMSPINGIDSTVTLTGSQVSANDIEITTTFYRGPPNMGSSGTRSSFGAPDYKVVHLLTSLPSVTHVNPLDAGTPVPFKRYNGYQTIVFTDTTTGGYFSFEIDCGIIAQANGYLGLSSSLNNARLVSAPEGCTVENTEISTDISRTLTRQIQFKVTSGFDGRQYYITFYPGMYVQTPPTIQLIAGAAFVENNVTVDVIYRRFTTI
jgi:hypothetical protein